MSKSGMVGIVREVISHIRLVIVLQIIQEISLKDPHS